MRRNWLVIAAISDYYTRVAISLATDPELLARFKSGWPECFQEGEDTGSLRIPLSVLRAAVEDAYREPPESCSGDMIETLEFALCFWLTVAREKFPELDLPIIAFGEGQDADIPQGVADQFVGQTPKDVIKLTWAGNDYIVVWANFATPPGERFSLRNKPNDRVKLDEPFASPPYLESFGMVLAKFVNLAT